MSDGVYKITYRDISYFLLIIVDFLLQIIFSVINSVISGLKFIVETVFDVNMTSKKRKRTPDEHNQTVAHRGLINANWQKLLSSNLIMESKTPKLSQESSNDHFTGTFRRARKKKSKDYEDSNIVQNNLKTLHLNNDSNVKQSNSKSIENSDNKLDNKDEKSLKNNNNTKNKLTKFIAMDCEMVGVGYDGSDHMLARVSLVNKFGDCIYDKFVKAREEVKDYRTSISGIRREDLLNGEEFTTVQKEVSELIRGRILVGHSLKNDLSVLFLSHPKRNIRDTSRYKPFRKITKGSTPSLKRLAKEILGIDIQHGEHSSVEDARAAMQLYCTVSKKWEATMSEKRGYNRKAIED